MSYLDQIPLVPIAMAMAVVFVLVLVLFVAGWDE